MISAQTFQAGRTRHAVRAPRARTLAALASFIIVILAAAPSAQQPVPPAYAPSPLGPSTWNGEVAPTPSAIDLLVGRSTVLNHKTPIVRVSLTVPDIADAMVTSPSQLLIHGKQPGTISLFVWDRAGAITTYEVTVRRDLSALAEHLKQLFPGEVITVVGSGKDVVVSGTVSSKYVIEKAADVAAGYVEKKDNVVNLMKQLEGTASNQVMLRVRFAEVSRTALTELGANFFTGPTGYKDWIARVTTSQFAAPNYSELSRTADLGDNLVAADGKWSLSDFLNIFLFNNKYNVGTVIRAMQEKGLFQSLAEPNLIATNGKEASFLAGGEYPYPVVQPGGGSASISIMFKEFGVRLRFTPTVIGGDLINLKVMPEVSALDFSNSITMSGYRVPALSTRRTETEVELRDGQTFAIAGLLNNTVTDTMRKIPGIGDIPILGWLFKSKAMAKNQTELVVMITPTIIRKGSMGVSEGLPAPVEPFMGAPSKTLQPPDPYTGSPRYPATRSEKGEEGATRPQPKDTATPSSQPKSAPAPAKPKSKSEPPKAPEPTSAPAASPQSGSPMASPAGDPGPSTQAAPSPVAATPLATPVQLPSSPYEPAPAPGTTAAVTAPAVTAPPAPATPSAPAAGPAAPAPDAKPVELTKEQKKAAAAAEKARREEEKRQAEALKEAQRVLAKQQAEQAKKQDEEQKRNEKLQQERAKREAEVAKKNAEIARKQAEEEKKRDKAIADAVERLKQAQAAYEAEIGKTKAEPARPPKAPGTR